MADPGRAYLYSKPSLARQRSTQSNPGAPTARPPRPGPEGHAHPPVAVSSGAAADPAARPSPDTPPRQAAGGSSSDPAPSPAGPQLDRWDAAVGNLEDARVGFDALAQAVEDAVYLDEDAFSQVAPIHQLTTKAQAQQRRIVELEALLADSEAQLAQSRGDHRASQQSVDELRQELENNAVVFKMHYAELMAKEDEISKLNAVIEALADQ